MEQGYLFTSFLPGLSSPEELYELWFSAVASAPAQVHDGSYVENVQEPNLMKEIVERIVEVPVDPVQGPLAGEQIPPEVVASPFFLSRSLPPWKPQWGV
jgi:hypothetical protein